MKFLKKLILSAFFVSSLLATSANAGDCKARLGDFDWSSANIHTAITQFILEKGYGCEVSVSSASGAGMGDFNGYNVTVTSLGTIPARFTSLTATNLTVSATTLTV